eukprot:TRINITY_DN8600_c2_g1_i1.p1 TRINITY_DN8600_c2_g1~~TRINITY_DN8600_c2_g1_i1.p1  ORF type:complete len:246 (+),score=37.21 TRINITY_DN8600_c2_g1_i1:110-847(+)
MIDSRAGLPQSLAGDNVGSPCFRQRPRKRETGLPSVELLIPEEKGFTLPGGNADTRPKYLAFTGSQSMDWKTARSRSCGLLRADRSSKIGDSLGQVLKLRQETDLDRLVEVLVQSAPDMKPEDMRAFKQPFNPHREQMASRYLDEETRRTHVLQVLRKYPLCNLCDLVRCDETQWNQISRDLGGLSYGLAMRKALQCVNKSFTPLERACFWAAVGNRQPIVDHGRTTKFAAMDPPPPSFVSPGYR